MYDEKTDLYEMQAENNVKNYNFITAYKSMFLKYSEFSGRSRRSEYWKALITLYGYAVIVPELALTIRRLHDTGRSAWWLLIVLVPLIGVIVLLIFMFLDSQPGTNKYGKNPKGE